MTNNSNATVSETEQQRCERILSREAFAGLKAILEKLSPGAEALWGGVKVENSYEQLLTRLGWKVVVTKQIHVQDCYSRVGPAGGIRAVLPYHDISTHSSFPTLVNFDRTVTTTLKSSAFFNEMLAELKRQLIAP